MRRITTALLVATMVLVSCGDDADNAAATNAEPTSMATTTHSPAPGTAGNTTTAQPTTTTTTQAPTTTQPTTTGQALATTTEMTTAGDDTADTASGLPDVVERYVESMMDGDASALAELFTDDGVMTGVVESHQRAPLSPPSVIRSMMGTWFSFVGYTDVEHEYVIAEGNTVVLVSMWSGTSSTHGRGGADPTPFSAPTVTVLRLEDGLIRSADAYFEYDQIVS